MHARAVPRAICVDCFLTRALSHSAFAYLCLHLCPLIQGLRVYVLAYVRVCVTEEPSVVVLFPPKSLSIQGFSHKRVALSDNVVDWTIEKEAQSCAASQYVTFTRH